MMIITIIVITIIVIVKIVVVAAVAASRSTHVHPTYHITSSICHIIHSIC